MPKEKNWTLKNMISSENVFLKQNKNHIALKEKKNFCMVQNKNKNEL